jgi:hypothetical protein
VAITIEDKHGEKAGQPKPTSDVMRLGHRSPKQSRKNMSIMIDPGGTDPFSRWPLEITPRINILIDHCKMSQTLPLAEQMDRVF